MLECDLVYGFRLHAFFVFVQGDRFAESASREVLVPHHSHAAFVLLLAYLYGGATPPPLKRAAAGAAAPEDFTVSRHRHRFHYRLRLLRHRNQCNRRCNLNCLHLQKQIPLQALKSKSLTPRCGGPRLRVALKRLAVPGAARVRGRVRPGAPQRALRGRPLPAPPHRPRPARPARDLARYLARVVRVTLGAGYAHIAAVAPVQHVATPLAGARGARWPRRCQQIRRSDWLTVVGLVLRPGLLGLLAMGAVLV